MGVAADVHDDDIDTSDTPQMYLPYRQNPSRIMHLLVRTQGSPLDWAAAVRGAVLAIDRDEPVFDVKTLEEIIAETFSRQRTFGEMLSAAAGLVLVLAATGIYALMAWAVSRRTREIGIRMAIGAAPSDVIRLVLRRHCDRQSQAFFLVWAARWRSAPHSVRKSRARKGSIRLRSPCPPRFWRWCQWPSALCRHSGRRGWTLSPHCAWSKRA
jgi:hypothetical protein